MVNGADEDEEDEEEEEETQEWPPAAPSTLKRKFTFFLWAVSVH